MRKLYLLLFISVIIHAQNNNPFSLGVTAGYSWQYFNMDEFRVEFYPDGEIHDYGFDNSYKFAVSASYEFKTWLIGNLVVSYMPDFTGVYKARDHNEDILMGKFDIDFISAILSTDMRIDSDNGIELLVGLGGGVIRRIRNVVYSFRANMQIYDNSRTAKEIDDGVVIEASVQLSKNIWDNIAISLKLDHQQILTGIPHTRFLTVSAGVIYKI